MVSNLLSSLSKEVKRIENNGLFVDLIRTSQGTVRAGSMPDISKYLNHYGFREEIVIVPDWEGSMAGDNYTGEEFVLWQAQVRNDLPKNYVGSPDNVTQLYRNLDETFSYFFDEERTSIVKKDWLKNWFKRQDATPVYQQGAVKISVERENIILSDHDRIIYDRSEFQPPTNQNDLVEKTLAEVSRDSAERQALEIKAIGTGNGFTGMTSSFVIRFGRQVLWIDPCGYPASSLAQQGVHWDDITHIIITHNHEDHIQGFSACLKRAEYLQKPLNLITAPSIHKLLQKQFTPLCPEFKTLVNHIPITPLKPLRLDTMLLECRWNHHFLPYGTLGFKISAGGKIFGFSGDTKLDETINNFLDRDELLPEWFALCDIVFHEVDFDNPGSVHTHWKQVEKLQQAIPGPVFCYHTPFLENAPLPLVEKGTTYILDAL